MTLMYSHKYFQAIEKIKLKKFILYFELCHAYSIDYIQVKYSIFSKRNVFSLL